MKKILSIALLTVTGLAHADFGSSFGGAMTGSVFGSTLGAAITQQKTQVVYVDDKRKIQDLQDENDSLRDKNADLKRTQADMDARLKALERKAQ